MSWLVWACIPPGLGVLLGLGLLAARFCGFNDLPPSPAEAARGYRVGEGRSSWPQHPKDTRRPHVTVTFEDVQ